MDLIQSLAAATGIPVASAQALAGAVLGAAKTQAGPAEAQKLAQAVPELDGWVTQAQNVSDVPNEEPASGFLDQITRFAGSSAGSQLIGAIGGKEAQEHAQLVAVLSRVGISPAQGAAAAPIVLSFIQQRLGDEWASRLLAAAPILLGVQQAAQPAAAAGAPSGMEVAAGLLGGLFGKK